MGDDRELAWVNVIFVMEFRWSLLWGSVFFMLYIIWNV